MIRKAMLFGVLLFFTKAAFAGGFEPKTMQEPLSNRSIERGLVLGKGWFQVTLGNDYKLSNGYWGSDGEIVDFENMYWMYTTQTLGIRYGITRRGELHWKMKSHYVELVNADLGTDLTQFGLGDPEFGYTFEILGTDAPLTSYVGYLSYKAPFANESPGNYVGGPNTFSQVVLTSGTADLTLGNKVKKQIGPVVLMADLSQVFRLSGLALYAIETDLNQFMVRVKPGNVSRVGADVGLQFGPIYIQSGALYQYRQAFKMGPSSSGILPALQLDKILDSEGWSLDSNTQLTLNIGQRIDLIGSASIPLRGEDLQFFPIEDIHPTYGYTYSGEIVFRF
jgi:hypothetical protein